MNSRPPEVDSYTEGLKVLPRHLAGGGDPRYVTAPLRHALRWKPTADPLIPQVKLTSPDTVSALTLDPSANGNRWWTISTCPRTGGLPWQASFDGHTPAEAIAAYADALTGITPAHRQDPFAVLKGAGWEGDSQSPRFVTSPDGLCEVEHFVDDVTDCWFVRTILPLPDQHRLWGAYFSGEAPPHLISAFAAALVDPAPLPRARAALPLGCHRHLVAAPPTWLSSTQHERQISARVASVRNAARRAQRAAAKNSTTPAPVPPPAPGSRRTH